MSNENGDSNSEATSNDGQDSSKLETAVAMFIALATIVGALVAWRAALSEDIAGDADYAGLRSLTWAEESKALHMVDAYEDYRLFIKYRYNDHLGDLIEAGLEDGSVGEDESVALNQDLEEARQIAEVNVSFLDETKASRYLNRDGTFALNRELGEKWSAARRKHDMSFTPRFDEADKYRDKTEKQLMAGIIITIGLVFFTLFESFAGGIRMVFLGLGAALFLWGTVWALLLERIV
jgi:hypothetical protein